MTRWLSCACVVLAVATAVRSAAAETPGAEPPAEHRALSASGLVGAYVGFGAWTWVAWYRDRATLPKWRFGGDGGFGLDSYAGGADKLGHAWTTLVLTRLGADLLEAGGWSDTAASAIAGGLCLAAFTMIEVNDGYYTEFSPGDLIANVAGVGAALAFRHVPELDEAFDFRVQWFPSREFRRRPGANFAEDYSGQTYLLAFKPRAIGAIRRPEGALQLLQFFNPVVGFESRNYVPQPPAGQRVTHRQTLFLGLTLDVQAILDVTLTNSTSATARVSGSVARTVFEYANLPFSTLKVAGASRVQPFVVPKE